MHEARRLRTWARCYHQQCDSLFGGELKRLDDGKAQQWQYDKLAKATRQNGLVVADLLLQAFYVHRG